MRNAYAFFLDIYIYKNKIVKQWKYILSVFPEFKYIEIVLKFHITVV